MAAPRLRISALLLVLGCAAVACGGGEPSDDEARSIGQDMLQGSRLDVDDEAELCLGRTMIDQVGLEAAESAASETDIAGLPDEQRDAVVESLNNCVPARAIAKTVMSAIVGAATDTPEANELLACLTTELEGRAGDILRQRDPSAAGDEFTELIEACPSGVPVDEGIASALRQSGRSPAVVECVMSALAGQITFAEIASQNPEATQKLEAAVIQCDQAGG